MKFQPSDQFRHPKQPQIIYHLDKSWEDNRSLGPIWKGKFPNPLPKKLTHQFLGLDLTGPIAIAAGPASGKLWTDFYFKMGYPLVIQKTHRTLKHPSNPLPNIAFVKKSDQLDLSEVGRELSGTLDPSEYTGALVNSFGNPECYDLIEWSNEVREQVKVAKKFGSFLFVSVTATILDQTQGCSAIFGPNATNAERVEAAMDMVLAAEAAVLAGADGIEANEACPNVGEGNMEGQMYQDAKLTRYAAEEFKKHFPSVPWGVKYGLFKSYEEMKKVLVEVGDVVDFWSGINTIAMPVLDSKGKSLLPGRKVIGFSGQPILEIGLKHTEWAAKIRVKEGLHFKLLSGGGITRSEDVQRFLDAGADMVQIGQMALIDPLFNNSFHFELSNKT